MKGTLFIFLVVCALSAAMVPRFRRAVESGKDLQSPTEICASNTPCGWAVYNGATRVITMNITNSYCNCKEGTECRINFDDDTAKAFILKCQDVES